MAWNSRSGSGIAGISLLCACLSPLAGAQVPPALTPAAIALHASILPADARRLTADARIGEIRFEVRNLFDGAAADADTVLTRLANRLHVATRVSTIADQLLFETGDNYDPAKLAESARLLRDTAYLRDAEVRPVAFHDGVVDVEVVTQDVWALTPSVSFGRRGGRNTSGFEIEDLNFLGRGMQVGLGMKSGLDRDSRFASFRDRQLGSTWWNLAASFADNSDGRSAALALDHPFYALDTPWAAGFSLLEESRIESRYDLGRIRDQFTVDERAATLYVGRSTGLRRGWVRRLTAGMSIDWQQFGAGGERPSEWIPEDRRLVYPWIAAEWVEDDFRTERNRDQIGKTEDCAFGWRIQGRVGLADSVFGADRGAALLSGSLRKGVALSDGQSLLFAIDGRGRIEDRGLRAGLLQAEARYYRRQSPGRLLYLNLSASGGRRLDADEQILLGGDSGLRGYPLRYQSGSGRWLFTAEQRFFTHWYPLQLFNVGAAIFYDMGAAWGRDPLGSQPRGLLRDVGVGLRLGNSRSARGSVLHIDLAVPLDGDSSLRGPQLLIETRKSF